MKKVGITPGPVKFDNMEESDVKQFTPSNTGTEGQILTKTSNGYNWETPSGGSDVGMFYNTIAPGFFEGQIDHGDILVDAPHTINAMITYTIRVKNGSKTIGSYTDMKASVLLNREIIDTHRYHGSCAFNAYRDSGAIFPILINANIDASVSTGETTSFDLIFRYSGVFKKTDSYLTLASVQLEITCIDFCVNE